jgi:hypothetical protein
LSSRYCQWEHGATLNDHQQSVAAARMMVLQNADVVFLRGRALMRRRKVQGFKVQGFNVDVVSAELGAQR